jgi:6-phosphogluconolactonase
MSSNMAQFVIQPDIQHIGELAASMTAEALDKAIKQYGCAVWVMAGGTAPMIAYKVLAEKYRSQLDWSKVVVLLGDERCVPLDDSDSNWHQIAPAIIDLVPIAPLNKLRPKSNLLAEVAAADYLEILTKLPKTEAGSPRLDIVWLGVGEDGHTLSLFPNHPSLKQSEQLVIVVHDSPKLPPDRITLNFSALQGAQSCIIIATGVGKAKIISKVRCGDANLPIMQAIRTIEAANGNVTWLVDQSACSDESL